MLDVVLKRFDNPAEVRLFAKGKFELIKIAGMTIGRATYEPGWKWSEHVSPIAGTEFYEVENLGWARWRRARRVARGETSGSMSHQEFAH